MRKALIVVDVQNDFCEGGSLAVTGGLAVAQGIRPLIRTGKYDLVVASLDWHKRNGDNGGHFGTDEHPVDFQGRWPAHCVAETTGAAFAPGVEADMFEDIFLKGDGEPAYSAFQGKGQVTGLSLKEFMELKQVDVVDVVGIAFDYCVKATAIDAVAAGLTTTVLSEWSASVDSTKDLDTAAEIEAAGAKVV